MATNAAIRRKHALFMVCDLGSVDMDGGGIARGLHPDLHGLVACALKVQRQLKAVAIDSSYVKGMPPGAILEQNPAGGSKVKKGRTVYLTINMDSAPKVSVPDIMDNSSLRQAEAKLRALGFRVTEPEYISGEKDWVYSVTYKGRTLNAGDKVPHEALLTLHVGNGNDELTNDSTLTDSTAIGDDDTPVVDKSWF